MCAFDVHVPEGKPERFQEFQKVWNNKTWKWFEYNGMYFDWNLSVWMIERKWNIAEKLDGQRQTHNLQAKL